MHITACLICLLGLARADPGASLEVVIEGVRSDDGSVRIALYLDPDGFPGSATPAATHSAPAAVGTVRATLTGLTPGRYGVAIYHDEDDDKQLDTNLLGMPKEGMAFGNGASPGTFRAPSFEACTVTVGTPDAHTTTTMRY